MVQRHPHIEDILKRHRSDLNLDYDKYRHHVYRVLNFALLLYEADAKDTDALAVAAAYHDMGIWTVGTLDYLVPSAALAKEYIKEKQLKVPIKVVEEIILNHHKVTTYRESEIVEAFRKADTIDLTMGIISHGISGKEISEIYDEFPGEWFHTFILGEIVKSAFRNPLNPLPILKW